MSLIYQYGGSDVKTVFECDKYQIFFTDSETPIHAIYDRNEKKVYELSKDRWTNLVLKVATKTQQTVK